MSTPKILIIGANGKIGTELTRALSQRYGSNAVLTSDLTSEGRVVGVRHEMLDATEASALTEVVERHEITQIYLLAAALSARGEQHPQWAWDLNMKGLLNVLELAPTMCSNWHPPTDWNVCFGRAPSQPPAPRRRAMPRPRRP